ncbi:hypothetical protein Tco_0509949, partial [Tanacetum coccineum]
VEAAKITPDENVEKEKITNDVELVSLETDIQEKDKKKAKNRQNQAQDGKDKVKSKPKSVKVKSQPSEENTT